MNIEAIATLIAVVLNCRGAGPIDITLKTKSAAPAPHVSTGSNESKALVATNAKMRRGVLGPISTHFATPLASANAELSADWEAFQRMRLILRGDLDRIDGVVKEDRIDEVYEELQVLASQKTERHYG